MGVTHRPPSARAPLHKRDADPPVHRAAKGVSAVLTPLLGLVIATWIILGPGTPVFDLTSFMRGLALFAVINWLLLPTIVDWWRAAHDRAR
jgi:hypothetical protein